MKNQLGKLHESASTKKHSFGFAGSQPEEGYDGHLLNDPSYEKKSVYVPDDIKKKINSWAEDMGLTPKKKKEKNMKNELRNYIRQLVAEALEELEEKEGKKKDVTGDGEADFTDVMASRMIASGISKEKAVKKAEKTTAKHQKK
jgi:hypothetical protein